MNKYWTAALLTLFLIPTVVSAQEYKNTPVTVSSEKVKSNGKVYYSHIVLEHQTLYSISKTYGVTYQEIIDANKSIDLAGGGLKTGQVLLIPDKGELPANPQPASEPAPQQIASPAPQQKVNQTETSQQPEDYILYTVKWYEDLSMIASRYNGMTKEILMAYNGMTSPKLTLKQQIKIPLHPEDVVVSEATKSSAKQIGGIFKSKAKNEAEDEQKPSDNAVSDDKVSTGTEEAATTGTEVVRDQIETLDSLVHEAGDKFKGLFKKHNEEVVVAVALPLDAKGKVNDSAYDLYSGILLAANDLGKEGIKADIRVYDTKSVQISSDDLEDCDLVIGPVDPADLEKVLGSCTEKTTVVSPLDPKAASLVTSYPNLVQAPSSVDSQYSEIVRWIGEECGTNDKVILIKQKGAVPTPLAEHFTSSDMNFSTLEYGILEGRAAISKLENLMTQNGTNRIAVASEDEAFVNDVVRNLNLMTYRKYDVILYAPSKIRNFDTIDVSSLHNINTHVACSYFVDYENNKIKNFLMSYRALFEAEPTPFAYQGYDAACFFIRNCASSDKDYKRDMQKGVRRFRGLQSDFILETEDAERCGYTNYGIRRVIFGEDYSISLQD